MLLSGHNVNSVCGSDPNHACETKRLPQMLLSGHNVNGVDYANRSALMVAACKSHVEILKMLLEAGADPDIKVGPVGN